jgi:hypothetical protein
MRFKNFCKRFFLFWFSFSRKKVSRKAIIIRSRVRALSRLLYPLFHLPRRLLFKSEQPPHILRTVMVGKKYVYELRRCSWWSWCETNCWDIDGERVQETRGEKKNQETSIHEKERTLLRRCLTVNDWLNGSLEKKCIKIFQENKKVIYYFLSSKNTVKIFEFIINYSSNNRHN